MRNLGDQIETEGERRPLHAVVVGGGTGAPVSIKTLRHMGAAVDAVVAMADDGGSTGILRERVGAIPPGDIRKCLIAMAADPDAPWVKAFRYRFDYVGHHALGNLIITALNDTGATFPDAIAMCERLLDCRGHVYPSTLDRITLAGRTRDGRDIVGQSAISKSDCALARVFLTDKDVTSYRPALLALANADLIVLGPGSLFTSIIPNLLVPGVLEAIAYSKAPKVFVCSIADVQGETWGLTAAEHVEALLDHGMRGMLDYVLVNQAAPQIKASVGTQSFERITGDTVYPTEQRQRGDIHLLRVDDRMRARIESQGPKVIMRDFVVPSRPTWHEPARLEEAFREVMMHVVHR